MDVCPNGSISIGTSDLAQHLLAKPVSSMRQPGGFHVSMPVHRQWLDLSINLV